MDSFFTEPYLNYSSVLKPLSRVVQNFPFIVFTGNLLVQILLHA